MTSHSSILLIEDSQGECELFRLALAQTGLDVALYTEQDADAALHFLVDRAHRPQSSIQYSLSEAAGMVSTARNIPPAQPLARQDALFPERAPSQAARSASTESMPAALPSLPSLILLDLHLHGQNGCDFLKRLRADTRFAAIPVVIFTTSDDPADLACCYASGANGYVVKPGTFEQLVQCVGDIGRYWIDRNLTSSSLGIRC
jgi:CheY-like chemotaxis protein